MRLSVCCFPVVVLLGLACTVEIVGAVKKVSRGSNGGAPEAGLQGNTAYVVKPGSTHNIKLQAHATTNPTMKPSTTPTLNPTSIHPTLSPTANPTMTPTTTFPTFSPTINPTTANPTVCPTFAPTATGVHFRKLQFFDEHRCSVPYCGISQEYEMKFSRKIEAECHFHTPIIPKSPLMIFGHSKRDHFHELAARIAVSKVVTCLVLLENAQDEWDYIKDMHVVANEMAYESTHPPLVGYPPEFRTQSVFHDAIGNRVGFMGVGVHASHAILANQMAVKKQYPEYLNADFNYTGVIALSPTKVRGVTESLHPDVYSHQQAPNDTPGLGPILVFAGSADCNSPKESHALPIYGIPQVCKTYVELKGGNQCYYPMNVTYIMQQEGYRGWLTEAYEEERQACLLSENTCIENQQRNRAARCTAEDCRIYMDPGLQKEIVRDIIGPWVRYVYLKEHSSFREFNQEILKYKSLGHVTYHQRSCEWSGNLP